MSRSVGRQGCGPLPASRLVHLFHTELRAGVAVGILYDPQVLLDAPDHRLVLGMQVPCHIRMQEAPVGFPVPVVLGLEEARQGRAL